MLVFAVRRSVKILLSKSCLRIPCRDGGGWWWWGVVVDFVTNECLYFMDVVSGM